MGNTYRNRPKFKVGDILEEYYYSVFRQAETNHLMVLEVKWERFTVLNPCNKRGKKVRRHYYSWIYTLKDLKGGRVFMMSHKSLDKHLIVKKVG
jgi:hypothetical protein